MVTQFLKPWSRGVPGTFGKMVGLGGSSAENLRPSNRELSFQAGSTWVATPPPRLRRGERGGAKVTWPGRQGEECAVDRRVRTGDASSWERGILERHAQ